MQHIHIYTDVPVYRCGTRKHKLTTLYQIFCICAQVSALFSNCCLFCQHSQESPRSLPVTRHSAHLCTHATKAWPQKQCGLGWQQQLSEQLPCSAKRWLVPQKELWGALGYPVTYWASRKKKKNPTDYPTQKANNSSCLKINNTQNQVLKMHPQAWLFQLNSTAWCLYKLGTVFCQLSIWP